jgi:hypothetical protein
MYMYMSTRPGHELAGKSNILSIIIHDSTIPVILS